MNHKGSTARKHWIATGLVTILMMLITTSGAAQDRTGGTTEAKGSESSEKENLFIPAPALFSDKDAKIEAFGVVTTEKGDTEDGKMLQPDELILEGTLINRSRGPVSFSGADGALFTIDFGEVAEISPIAIEGCSVTCGAGFYACCDDGIFSDSCKCRRNGTSDSSCNSGGAGSTSCSLGAANSLAAANAE